MERTKAPPPRAALWGVTSEWRECRWSKFTAGRVNDTGALLHTVTFTGSSRLLPRVPWTSWRWRRLIYAPISLSLSLSLRPARVTSFRPPSSSIFIPFFLSFFRDYLTKRIFFREAETSDAVILYETRMFSRFQAFEFPKFRFHFQPITPPRP